MSVQQRDVGAVVVNRGAGIIKGIFASVNAAGTVVNQLTIPLVSTNMDGKPFRIAFAQFK